MKSVLAHIHSDSSHCVNGGRARHDGAPSTDKPSAHSEWRRGRERGRSIPFTTGRLFRADRRYSPTSLAKQRKPSTLTNSKLLPIGVTTAASKSSNVTKPALP